jgi:hypothetical protein
LLTISRKPVGVWVMSQRLILGRKDLDCRAYRGDGKRFVVRADKKLTALLELESAIRDCSVCSDDRPGDGSQIQLALSKRFKTEEKPW